MPSTSGSMSFGGRRGAESGCRPLAARAFSVPHRGLVCKEPDHGHGHGVPWPPACGWRPTPSVDAVHLAVRPRELAGSARGQRVLRALPAAAYARPRASRCGVVGEARPGVGVVAPAAGSPAGELARRPAPDAPATAEHWHDLATMLTRRDRPDWAALLPQTCFSDGPQALTVMPRPAGGRRRRRCRGRARACRARGRHR
jgi:hypothetical protein